MPRSPADSPTLGADPAPTPPMAPVEVARPTVDPAIREAKPSVYYLKDKDGNLVPVPGFSFEDFERLLRLDRKLASPDTPPRFSVQKLSASGTVEGDRALLKLEATVALRDADWVRVPLRCESAFLREPVRVAGGAEQAVQFERGEGYIVWLKGPPDKPQTITLQLIAPIDATAEGQRMALALPKAASSDLRLRVPGTQVTATTGAGAILLKPTVIAETKQTELSVLGLTGDFQLTWREPPAELQTTLEATANQLVTLEGPDALAIDVWIKIRGFGQPVDRFRVRIPAGVTVEPRSDASFSLAPVSEGGTSAVEIKLARPTAAGAEVHFVARATRPAGDADRWFDVTGFAVVGAARQSGHVAFATEGDWTLRWGEVRHAQRVDELPEALRTPRVKAGFEYYRPDFLVQMAVLPQRTFLMAEPTYRLAIERDEARLDATFRMKVRGAKLYQVELQLPEWQLDSVEPESMIDLESFLGDSLTPLRIPLARATGGEFELKIRARRRIVPGAAPIAFRLPSPVANSVAPPLVVVTSADNVRLTPRTERMPGFVEESPPAADPTVTGSGNPHVYRVRGDASAAEFVATVEPEPRVVQVAVSGQASIDERSARVALKLAYQVLHERLDTIHLQGPPGARQANNLSVLHDGRSLPVVWTAGEGDSSVAEVRLPTPRIGSFEVALEWTAQLSPPPNEASDLQLDLVRPILAQITRQELSVSAPAEQQVIVESGAWKPLAEDDATAAASRVKVSGTEDAGPLVFRLERRTRIAGDNLSLDKVWVQTLLTRGGRQDRVALRFTTDRPALRVLLPEGVRGDDVDVILDGVPPPRRAQVGERELSIELPTGGLRDPRVLELWYPVAAGRPARGSMTLEAPQLVGARWVRQVYWQLILPDDEHLVFEPRAWTSENRWSWARGLWGQSGQLDQVELERWLGATQQESPPQATRRYLFSTTGSLPALAFSTWDRRWLLLVFAGVVLAGGILLIYVPLLRQPGMLFVAAVLVLAVGMEYPALAILGAQAALLGLVLVAGAHLLEWFLVRRRGERGPARMAAVEARTLERKAPPAVVVASGTSAPAATADKAEPASGSAPTEAAVHLPPLAASNGSSHPTTATAAYVPPLAEERP